MTAPAVKALPAQYAKFITALAAAAVTYLTAYGATWHLNAALVALAGALAVLGVPNAPKAAAAAAAPVPGIRAPEPPGNVTVQPPAAP